MTAITDKDIYKGKPNPFDDVTKGAEILIREMNNIIAKGGELSKSLKQGIQANPKKTTEDFRKLKKLKKNLSKDQIEILKEIAEIKRKENPVWGI